MTAAYLGVDIGTFESKGALVDGEGRLLASAARSHKMLTPRAGWAEHRAEEDWWGEFCALSRELIGRSGLAPGEIRAVGASGIGPCVLPVDAEGTPLSNAILYGVDTRAAAEIEELTGRIGVSRLVDFCGNALTSQSIGPKILWLKHNRPEIFARTHKFLNSTSFLVHRLTGRFVVDQYTAANATPLYSVDELAWTDRLTAEVTPLDRLPEIAWTTEVAGSVTERAAQATGLQQGTPVIVGTIDAAAEAVSAGVIEPGQAMLMYGSTIFIVLVTEARLRDPRLWWAPWLFPGCHAALAGLATSGTLTHWFRDQFARELTSTEGLGQLAREAAGSPPGARGLVFLPYFSGERTPIHDPNAKGVWFGLHLAHERADLVRALLEGVAYGTRHAMETYGEAGAGPDSIHAVGGGLRNPVWTQATSDICGLSQHVMNHSIGASYGDAFLAALAIGDVDATAIRQWNPVASIIEPNPLSVAVYERQYAVFRQLYSRTQDLMAALDD